MAKERLAKGELPPEIAAKISTCPDAAAFNNLVACGPTERSLKAMLDRFIFFLPIVQGQFDALERLAFAFVKSQAAQNVVYCELRYSPHILTTAGEYQEEGDGGGEGGEGGGGNGDAAAAERIGRASRDARLVVEAVTRGLRRGCDSFPSVEVRQILCLIDGRGEWASSLLELAKDFREGSCAVVGVDIAAGEAHFLDAPSAADEAEDPAEADASLLAAAAAGGGGGNGPVMRAACRHCAAAGFAITIHAGESGPFANVAASTSKVYGGAMRIGHGYAAVDATCVECKGDGAFREAAAAIGAAGVPPGVTFETCPTSSIATGGWVGGEWVSHPAARLHRWRAAAEAAGESEVAARFPKVTVSSDDPAVFGASLTEEVELVGEEMGLGAEGLRATMVNSVEAAFVREEERGRLMEKLEAAWEAWRSDSDPKADPKASPKASPKAEPKAEPKASATSESTKSCSCTCI